MGAKQKKGIGKKTSGALKSQWKQERTSPLRNGWEDMGKCEHHRDAKEREK